MADPALRLLRHAGGLGRQGREWRGAPSLAFLVVGAVLPRDAGVVRRRRSRAPTPAQDGAWEAIAGGRNALVVAPTGSGKTLAAFLWSLDRLASEPLPAEPQRRCRVLYVSPLKALAVDVERNLRAPLAGIRHAAARLGLPEPDITVGVRSGDTPADERRRFGRHARPTS